MEKQRGKFIVLDAISGAGKGKQIELLKKKLSDCYFDFEPSDEFAWEVIHSIIERRGCREETLKDVFLLVIRKMNFGLEFMALSER